LYIECIGVIDCIAGAARDADVLITADHRRAWEGRREKIAAVPDC